MLRALSMVIGAALVLGACSGAPIRPAWTYPPSRQEAAASASPNAEPAAPAPSAEGQELEIEAFDLGFKPTSLEVPAAGRYEVKLVNTGSAPHDITFPTGEMAHADPGETASVEVDIPAGGTTFLCSIPGHADAGMTGEVKVAGAAASPSANPDDHGGPAPATNVEPDPNAPAPVRYDPTAPDALPGTVHDIDLVMTSRR